MPSTPAKAPAKPPAKPKPAPPPPAKPKPATPSPPAAKPAAPAAPAPPPPGGYAYLRCDSVSTFSLCSSAHCFPIGNVAAGTACVNGAITWARERERRELGGKEGEEGYESEDRDLCEFSHTLFWSWAFGGYPARTLTFSPFFFVLTPVPASSAPG